MTQPEHEDADLLTMHVSANRSSIRTLLAQLTGRIEEAVAQAIAKEIDAVKTGGDLVAAAASPKASTPGVLLDDQERLKAADLRTALLMGKIPQDAGLLIDTKMAARLLNVSARTLYRLHQLGATPDPVRIGGKIIRFRLAELLAWIEADCPPKKHWSYSPDSTQTKRRK